MRRDILLILSDAWRGAPLETWDDSGEALLHPADRAALDRAAALAVETGGTLIAAILGGESLEAALQAARALGASHAARVECSESYRLSAWQAAERLLQALDPETERVAYLVCGERRPWEPDCLGPALAHFSGASSAAQAAGTAPDAPILLCCPASSERRIPHCSRVEEIFSQEPARLVSENFTPAMPLLQRTGFAVAPEIACRIFSGAPEKTAVELAHALLVRLEAPGREAVPPLPSVPDNLLAGRAVLALRECPGGIPRRSSLALHGYAERFARAHGADFSCLDSEDADAETLALRIAAEKPAAVLIPATSGGNALAHSLAARLRRGLAPACCGLAIDATSGELEALRLVGSKLERIACEGPLLLATITPPADPDYLPAQYADIPLITGAGPLAKPLLNEHALVAFGRGCAADMVSLVEELAASLGAACIPTRGAADLGLAGQESVRLYSPFRETLDVYLGIGVSGVFPHLDAAGEALCRMAVNRDENSLIFQLANYGIVSEAEAVLPLLAKALRTLRRC